jgi:hypothetical protein
MPRWRFVAKNVKGRPGRPQILTRVTEFLRRTGRSTDTLSMG